jgi:curved DNA-binding protein CbpA
MTPGSAASYRAIDSALLEYHKTPGKFALIRKQPALLFSSMKEVLQIASGRAPDGQEGVAPSAATQRAACFFVHAALLYPDADHYSLLGVRPQADAAAIKDRYRLMMRLMHPDFASSMPGTGWPPDAATRVNRAYEVLSSPVRRREYDSQLDEPPKPQAARTELRALVKVAPPTSMAQDRRQGLRMLVAFFGGAGALAILAIVYSSTNDKETLVQRSDADSASTSPRVENARTAAAVPAQTNLLQQPLQAAPLALLVELEPQLPTILAPRISKPAMEALAAYPQVAAATKPIAEAAMPIAVAAAAPAVVPIAPVAPPAPAAAPAPTYLPAQATPPSVAAVTMPTPPALPALAPVRLAPAPNPGVTLAEVHPLLSRLLQQMETGSGDRLLSVLERDARNAPSAQALLQYFNSLSEGKRLLKVSDVQFKAEPREGHLRVTGHVRLHTGDQPAVSTGKELWLQADFISREGTVVMTRLARATDN